MKQLIKLSQELIPEDQIEAEIEKQSTTFEGPNNSSIQDDPHEVDPLDDRQVHMLVDDPLQPPIIDEDQEELSKINIQVEEPRTSIVQIHS